MKIKCLPFYKLNLDEFYASMALRQEVFVVEQDCPYLDADGKDQEAWHVMGWDEDGDMVVIKAGPGLNGQAEVLAEINMGTAIYTTPIAQDGVIYIATRNKLFAIGE